MGAMTIGKQRDGRRRAIVLSVLGAMVLAMVTVTLFAAHWWQEAWRTDAWARPALIMHLASAWTALAAGIWMTWRRPMNWCGPVGMGVGVAFGLWFIPIFAAPQFPWLLFAGSVLLNTFRPLLFWLVLAFPVGRLDRVSRRFLVLYIAGTAFAFALAAGLDADGATYPAVFQQWSESTFTLLALSAWNDVASLVAVAALLVIVQRRRLRFRTLGDRVDRTAWWAAAVATFVDFQGIAFGPLRDLQRHHDLITPYGSITLIIDYARYGLVVLLIAVAARRAWPAGAASGGVVELSGGVDTSLRSTLARAVGDPRADVAIADGRTGWLDLDGRRRAEPGTAGAATVVTHDRAPVVALDGLPISRSSRRVPHRRRRWVCRRFAGERTAARAPRPR
jgi:hypothetical protein